MEEFELIYKEFYRDISNYFYYLYGNMDIVSELTQETFYKVFISLHTFSYKCSLKTWVFSIAKHTHYQHLNQKSKLGIVELVEVENFADQIDKKITIHSVLYKLREPYKQVVILHIVNDLSFKQIAYLMDKTENWAKVTFHRGKIMLKEYFEEDLL